MVFFAGETRNYKKTVIIDHQNGYFSVYGGDFSFECRKDQVVSAGGRIGRMADNQARPLLYFEIRRGAEPVNPLPYLK
ncbi:MAG: Murein hydrolase activator NlpD precursor [candidate division TA06 bacterium ADurb.Bin417]|uniref:Murein hydrolase activator NlpD n=1 Tax=candidate division TA06 bacterium ADurb.Bin417 TaxID=1852828 RepID=A0A1V5M8N9_UNCT6|nr:MAG: Murein hydrolase activator NlpD precursor [candidate division TA06 bacterium ADurb.Bin417]